MRLITRLFNRIFRRTSGNVSDNIVEEFNMLENKKLFSSASSMEIALEQFKDYMISEIESILACMNQSDAEPLDVFHRINGLYLRLMAQHNKLRKFLKRKNSKETFIRLEQVARDVRAEMEALYLILHQQMVVPEGRFHEFMFEINKCEECIMMTYLRLYEIAKQRASTQMFMERHLAVVDDDFAKEIDRIRAEYESELGTPCVQTMLAEMNARVQKNMTKFKDLIKEKFQS